jgi:hypothetical protein
MKRAIRFTLITAALGAALAGAAAAQSMEGDWHGLLEIPPAVRIGMHVEKDAGGVFKVLAYNDTQEPGHPASNWSLTQTGDQVKLSSPNNGGQRLELKWSPAESAWKGQYFAAFGTFPVAMTKGAIPPVKVDGLDGEWSGALDVGSGQQLRLSAVLATSGGATTAYLLSPDQTQEHIPMVPARDGQKIIFNVPGVMGFFAGALSADGKSLEGAWSQGGNELPLKLTKK